MTEKILNTYTVIDVETPNRLNDSICSIGLVHVNNGSITTEYYLVNPECEIESRNIEIHGITKAMVINEATFPEIWGKISKYFNYIMIAHNAQFDLGVITKLLTNYGMEIPDMKYLCTYKESRKVFRHFERFSLDGICDTLGIELNNHHNALSDAVACQQIFERLKNVRPYTVGDAKCYKMKREYVKTAEKPVLVKSLNTLYGMVMGILSDGQLNDSEKHLMQNWIFDYQKYSRSFPYCEIYPVIKDLFKRNAGQDDRMKLLKVSESHVQFEKYNMSTLLTQIFMGILEGICCDGHLDLQEIYFLKNWMDEYKDYCEVYPLNYIYTQLEECEDLNEEFILRLFDEFINILNPIEVISHVQISLKGKTICLTGDFINGARSDIETYIIEKGGSISKNVTQKTNILIVGGEGSKSWSYGNFGTKVKKAMELKDRGKKISIIAEEDFFVNVI